MKMHPPSLISPEANDQWHSFLPRLLQSRKKCRLQSQQKSKMRRLYQLKLKLDEINRTHDQKDQLLRRTDDALDLDMVRARARTCVFHQR